MQTDDLSKYFTRHAIKQMKKNGLTLKQLGGRLFQGSSLEDAFAFKTRGRKSPLSKDLYDKAKKNGISSQALHKRLKKQGMSIEEAATKPLGRWVDKKPN